MTTDVSFARDLNDLDGLEALLQEYLDWDIALFREATGADLSAEDYLQNTLSEIDLYFPPQGRLLLVRNAGQPVGMGFLKPIGEGLCEIKRMYVQPDQRGKGLGREILASLIAEARIIGYKKVLLDSATYMTAAHALYRSLGFTDSSYYAEGETDKALKAHLIFMEMTL